MKDLIFIHIPKTGGTTLNCAIHGSDWQTEPDFYYRHISAQTYRSNSGDIFNPLKQDKLEGHTLFTILRHPVDRLISEYYFLKNRPEYMSLLKPRAQDLKSFARHRQTRNYMIGFLLGRRIYDTEEVTESDYELVRNTFDSLPIYTGIFERFEDSLMYLQKAIDVKWPKKIEIKRATLNRPKLDEVDDDIKEMIKEYNSLDLQLYNHCLDKLERAIGELPKKSFEFTGSKYDYVIKYTQRFPLIEIGKDNMVFVKWHHDFLDQLNRHLHFQEKIKDGRVYVESYNRTLVRFIKDQFEGSPLAQELDPTKLEQQEPLEATKWLASFINQKTTNAGPHKKLYQQTAEFNPALVEVKRKGFLSRLFG